MKRFSDKIKSFILLILLRKSRFPESVSIEITTYCNFRCGMCYRENLQLKDRHLSREIFVRINDQLPRNIRKISLSGLGEGLMCPDFLFFLHQCREKHPKSFLDFTTNGLLLRGDLMQGVLAGPVDMVTFSLDTISRPIPAMGHSATPEVVENIKKFSALAKSRVPRLSLRLQSVVFSEDQVLELQKFAEEIGFDVVNFIRMDVPINSGYQRLPIDDFRSIFKQAKAWGRRTGISVVSSGYHSLPMKIASRFDRICLQYHNFLYFTVDGEVLPCCVLRDFTFGNIMNKPLMEIWNSVVVKGFFKQQKHLCKKCDVWKHDYSH